MLFFRVKLEDDRMSRAKRVLVPGAVYLVYIISIRSPQASWRILPSTG